MASLAFLFYLLLVLHSLAPNDWTHYPHQIILVSKGELQTSVALPRDVYRQVPLMFLEAASAEVLSGSTPGPASAPHFDSILELVFCLS